MKYIWHKKKVRMREIYHAYIRIKTWIPIIYTHIYYIPTSIIIYICTKRTYGVSFIVSRSTTPSTPHIHCQVDRKPLRQICLQCDILSAHSYIFDDTWYSTSDVKASILLRDFIYWRAYVVMYTYRYFIYIACEISTLYYSMVFSC